MKLELIKDIAFNDCGDILKIVSTDDSAYYYYDSCGRWCYLNKSEEGVIFKIVKNRTKKLNKK